MNFLNDKKNLPIIIAVVVVVLIGAIGGGLYFSGVFGHGSGTVVATGPSTPPPGAIPDPSSPSGYRLPGSPGLPGSAGPLNGMAMGGRPGAGMTGHPGAMAQNPYALQNAGAAQHQVALGGPSAGESPRPGIGMQHPGMVMQRPGLTRPHSGKLIGQVPGRTTGLLGASKTQVASTAGVPTSKIVFHGDPTVGPDPFYTKMPPRPKFNPFGTPPDLGNPVPPLPPIDNTQAPITLPINTEENGPVEPVETNDSFRRVSGILHSSDGVYAVLETNGVSQTVQPGDDVGGAKVTGIDDNGVTLKTDDNKVLHVPLSDTATAVSK